MTDDFYVRYYVGHKGMYGHEYLEFEFKPNGKLVYSNASRYRNETTIRKEVYVGNLVREELQRIIDDSQILKKNDNLWPEPDRVGTQELEIVYNNEHISFQTAKIGSLLDIKKSDDAEGLRTFYYLVQDLKCFVFAMIGLHFKIKPVPVQ
eukprot:TRINITY_DN3022_c0_g1_i2.p1 TRINITY_DN3022_c0_g1~~TRINITY_DN3022_c0_g1_i2.p1  ORF type:complete len:150 (+),score=22.24 TRINITY_DN3022_c0_g1_i2:59-508(+)